MGAPNATESRLFPRFATRPDGGPGATGDGTTLFDAAEAALVPGAFVADALHVYVLPFVNPLTRIGLVAPDAEPVTPPSDDGHVTR
jgi:hypothetical protein